MRTQSTPGKTVSYRTRRIATGFAVLLLTSICIMSLPSRLRAEGAGTGTGVCTIAYFNASSVGTDRWFLEGFVQADDLSAVTISFGGAAASVGSISPDQYGMFSFEIDALAYDYVSAEASDGIASSNASLTLYDML